MIKSNFFHMKYWRPNEKDTENAYFRYSLIRPPRVETAACRNGAIESSTMEHKNTLADCKGV